MKKSDLLVLFEELDFHPGKQLGQNFLMDDNLLDYIIRNTNPSSSDTILEVGPGFGALTRKLVATGATVVAVEFDKRLSQYLRNNIKAPNFRLIESDICKLDLRTVEELQNDFRCIANLPYSVSSPFIAELLTLDTPPKDMFFMLQKEMAERIAADTSTKNYGSLSVRVQQVYDLKYMRTVPPQVFFPPPDIASALLSFKRKPDYPSLDNRKQLANVAKLAFSQRRKKLINLLTKEFGKENCQQAIANLGLPETIRAEKLDADQFTDLTQALYQA